MKTIWTLTVKTSLPDVCRTKADLKITNEVFESFEESRNRMREILKELAFSKNAMFDGNGRIMNFDCYITDREDEEDPEDLESDVDSDWISSSFMKMLCDRLRDAFLGKDTELPFSHSQYSDMFITVKISANSMLLKGDNDGPINNIIPYMKTNMFDMTEEKDYFLYIDDFFGGLWGQECSAELYIDLNKTVLSE